MKEIHARPAPRVWAPEFDYERRADGTILMRQRGALPPWQPTLSAYLAQFAQAAPERTFLARRVAGGDWRHVSYAEALDTARRIGAALLALGLGPDRPVLILSENSLEHALLGLGAMWAGVPFAPVSPAYALVSTDHGKLRDIAALLNPGLVFADDGAAFGPALAALAAPGRRVVTLSGGPAGAIPFADLCATPPGGADAAQAATGPDTVVKYLFTSGSTGAPKAVVNTHGMISSNQAMVRDCYRFLTDAPPVILDWAPWNHTAAGNKVFHMALTNGGTYHIDDGRPGPRIAETLRNLREIAPTWYFNVPVGWDALSHALEEDRALAERFFSRLDMMMYAGAGMAQHTWDRLQRVARRVTGRDVILATGLGSTETAPFALASAEVLDRSGNVGVPARGITLKLVPIEDKLEARLKGPSIMPGYYGDPARSAEVFDEEGFYRLGDALRPADPEDYAKGFFFDGRIAENFKLATGTWVGVGAVRAVLVDALGGLARDAVIVGEDRTELGALLLLAPRAEAMAEADLHAALAERLAAHAAAATGSAARVRRLAVLARPPALDRGELTDKGSLNQRALRAHNAAQIAQLYEGGPGVVAV
jgi:feruloyl-CoA synthase